MYYGVVSEGGSALIGQKRVTSDFFEGRATDLSAVNGAGQWAFPGGGIDDKVKYIDARTPAQREVLIVDAAKREFREETGVDVGALPVRTVHHDNFSLVLTVVQPATLDQIVNTANHNIRETDNDRTRRLVEDLEMSMVVATPVANLHEFLGIRIPFPAGSLDGADVTVRARANKEAGLIDWNATMARDVQTAVASGALAPAAGPVAPAVPGPAPIAPPASTDGGGASTSDGGGGGTGD